MNKILKVILWLLFFPFMLMHLIWKKMSKNVRIAVIILFVIFSVIGAFSEDNQPNEHVGEAKMPSDSISFEGDDYHDVVYEFEEHGFMNIKTKALEDLITGWLTEDGEVESVSVNGDVDYSQNIWYPNDVEVIITYHTFSSEENGEKSEPIKLDGVEDKEETQNVETSINGFDIKNNQTLQWCGIDFSFPSYYDVLDDNSYDGWMMYYPKEEEYYSSLLFQSQEYYGSTEQFRSIVSSIVESKLKSEEFTNAEIYYSKSTSIAELPGWIFSYSIADQNDGIITSGISSFIYNESVGKIAVISCMYDSIDQSEYDYLGDFEKILETSILSNEIQSESIYEKGYKVRFQDYDICYLIDEDEKIISIFNTTDYYVNTYTYTGDFNNGIMWDYDGLKMRAHYHYVNQDSTLIITDANGIQNKALNFGVDTIEGYLKKYGPSN